MEYKNSWEGSKQMLIVIKFGSQILADRLEPGERVNLRLISEWAKQLQKYHKLGHRFLIVSSGAIASAKNAVETSFGVHRTALFNGIISKSIF
jgi:glutamate 5-kinase